MTYLEIRYLSAYINTFTRTFLLPLKKLCLVHSDKTGPYRILFLLRDNSKFRALVKFLQIT